MAVDFSSNLASGPDVDPTDDDDAASDTSSVLTEIDRQDFPAYFMERDGRLFPSEFFPPHGTRLSGPYPLPVDGHEQTRLNQQHELLKELIHENYVGPVKDILSRSRSRGRVRALDLCTGTGKWVIDMAREFPHVKFTGLDIVPIAPQSPPRNVYFELHDITRRFRFPTGSIDFIHARDASSMSSDNYAAMLDEASRTLRPGGLLLLCEWGRYPALHTSSSPPRTQIPAAYEFHEALIDSLRRVKGITDLSTRIPVLLQQTNAFSSINVTCHTMPIGEWSSDPRMKDLGSRFRESVKVWLDSSRPLLREGGYSDGIVDALVRGYQDEMDRVDGMISIYYTIWASRR